ncbi:NUC189-domain-containing protein [Annulohypoxylon truncatum]|uniref:NUC189-domain-containing protein n=1 Tax=Annulohypoxylon truncatum TaxID=327061 RepID=UPI0020087C1E|nr:NUC189-domain-containing protein [Annulohypoxylon truncatum]KAI1210765.1 NUC189-domain-containing protein [Annulohypoxylon truncatum]
MSTKRKLPTKITHPVVKQDANIPLKASINESETAVSVPDISKANDVSAEQVIEISSDSGSSEYDYTDDERDAGENAKLDDMPKSEVEAPQGQSTIGNALQSREEINGGADIDMPSPKPATDGESDQESTQPTFGELARAHDTIDVPAAISTQSPTLPAPGRALAPPSLSSLGTVLSQALRTDDADLLESCLHTNDLTTIRNTIQRLDSTLAGTLLIKLASRMHRRPGRAGSLMTWVQWTLVAHGGALATQPGLAKKLGELHRVLEERSRGLNSLLALKGKLDLLEAQMELRRGLQRNVDSDDDNDDEEGIVYVEGEESGAEIVNGAMDLDDDDDELPVTNGIAEDDSEDDEEPIEEDEVELEGQEELDESDVNHEDVESDEEDSEPEVAEPQRPVKRTRTKRR